MIARARLPIADGLRLVRRNLGRGHHISNEVNLASALAIAYCNRRQSSILEWTNNFVPLTAPSLRSGNAPTSSYVIQNHAAATALKALVPQIDIRISLKEFELVEKFDTIVCAPPAWGGGGKGDEYGTQIVLATAAHLADEGTLFWHTGRAILFHRQAATTFKRLAENGLEVAATIDIPPGALEGTNISSIIIALRRSPPTKKLLASIRHEAAADYIASELLLGPRKVAGPGWLWTAPEDVRTYADVEQAELVSKLAPTGKQKPTKLESILANPVICRADQPIEPDASETDYLYVPEYVESRVTADLKEQSVKLKSVYRLTINGTSANPRFLAKLLNSAYGKQVRDASGRGITIRRLSAEGLRNLEVKLPEKTTQDQIAEVSGDLSLLQTELANMQLALETDWSDMTDLMTKVEALKAILDVEKRIANWWDELPYPLATIYRRYQFSSDPKEQLDSLLQFFEMAAIYLAAVGTSYVRNMRQDWQSLTVKWFRPQNSSGITRADFGFWCGLAGTSLKELKRTTGDATLRKAAIELAGKEFLEAAEPLATLSRVLAWTPQGAIGIAPKAMEGI